MQAMKTTDYRICETNRDLAMLEKLVREYIRRGWEPIGGFQMVWSDRGNSWWYYQPIIKRELVQQSLAPSQLHTTLPRTAAAV
jgi:hypothetical protein